MWIAFIIGFIIGMATTIFVIGILSSSKCDRCDINYRKQIQHEAKTIRNILSSREFSNEG